MKSESMQIGRIRAILEAAESVVACAKKHNDIDTVKMAKETAYDSILGIINDPAYCPWQE